MQTNHLVAIRLKQFWNFKNFLKKSIEEKKKPHDGIEWFPLEKREFLKKPLQAWKKNISTWWFQSQRKKNHLVATKWFLLWKKKKWKKDPL